MTGQAERAKSIFLAAIEKYPPDQWRSYLDGACGDDQGLRSRVDDLLKAHGELGSFHEAPVEAATATLDVPSQLERAGTLVGPYKLLQQIGEGGMGFVYMAEQTQPVERRVALKIIKPGMDSRQVIARFEAERQALAMMDHPNIARVLDAATTDSGRPYFVMELVKGLPITKYCDAQHLTPKHRLELFIPVCHAVQHAHQKGIIHRDLKPSNVLIAEYDGRPVPKVIDFGVAKALHHRLTEKTLFTEFGQVIGTPAYMSPEQTRLNQLDVDTRSDIYSLGVLLYELLTGTTPFAADRLSDSSWDELFRMICEEEPPKPSTRVGDSDTLPSIAASRNTEPQKLAGLIRGDLDWIVIKALAKDRNERYQTASALAEDIQRHLKHLPIEARRPSTLGRVRRFVHRNKVFVALGTCAATALVLAVLFAVVATASRLREANLVIAAREADAKRAIVEQLQRQQQLAREETIPNIKRLLSGSHLVPAFEQARRTREILPGDPTLEEVWQEIAQTATVESSPAGARIRVRDWHAAEDSWLELGETPLVNASLPNGVLRWRLSKPGYVPVEFNGSVSGISSVELRSVGEVPDGMVYMPPGNEDFLEGLELDLAAFFIDRYEVTNSQFQYFVDSGGYDNPDYWRHEIVKEGKPLSWKEAVERFRDETGHQGPATWRDGRFPDGQDDYPVRGVSWYEAAAYAEFAGKSLPTIHHWVWAARIRQAEHVVPLSNFSGVGASPVGTHIGIGRFDVFDMAGNVKEWCWNGTPEGHRWIRGGAWDSAAYMFGYPDNDEPLAREPTYGFRCVTYLEEHSPEAFAASELRQRSFDEERPTREQVEGYKRQYLYNTSAPLNLESRQRTEADHYIHEVVRVDSAYEERFDIHLLLPKAVQPPYETIVWYPTIAARWRTDQSGLLNTIDGTRITAFVERGRAVCWPVYKGTFDRGTGPWPDGFLGTVGHRDLILQVAKDLRRSVDYLQTRVDINLNKLSYIGVSSGAYIGPVMTVVEPRFKAAVLISGGYIDTPVMPEVEPYSYMPFVQIPVLMINSVHDPVCPRDSMQMPFFKDLGSSSKSMIDVKGAHITDLEATVHNADEWLRETFGARN